MKQDDRVRRSQLLERFATKSYPGTQGRLNPDTLSFMSGIPLGLLYDWYHGHLQFDQPHLDAIQRVLDIMHLDISISDLVQRQYYLRSVGRINKLQSPVGDGRVVIRQLPMADIIVSDDIAYAAPEDDQRGYVSGSQWVQVEAVTQDTDRGQTTIRFVGSQQEWSFSSKDVVRVARLKKLIPR